MGICLDFLAKFQVSVDKETLPLYFANAVVQNNSQFNIITESSTNTIILKSLCLELSDSLASPPTINNHSSKIVFNFISAVTKFFED